VTSRTYGLGRHSVGHGRLALNYFLHSIIPLLYLRRLNFKLTDDLRSLFGEGHSLVTFPTDTGIFSLESKFGSVDGVCKVALSLEEIGILLNRCNLFIVKRRLFDDPLRLCDSVFLVLTDRVCAVRVFDVALFASLSVLQLGFGRHLS
jgi:hypothetical protein